MSGTYRFSSGPPGDRTCEGQAGRHDAHLVRSASLDVGISQLGGHLGRILIRPRHEQHRLGAMAARYGGIARHALLEQGAELRVYRALAAIHHQHGVEQLGQSPVADVEHHFVFCVERVRAHATGLEVRLQVMPVEARAADGGRGLAPAAVAFGAGAQQQADVAVHAVVVVEEAVADPQHGQRWRARCRRGGRAGDRPAGGVWAQAASSRAAVATVNQRAISGSGCMKDLLGVVGVGAGIIDGSA